MDKKEHVSLVAAIPANATMGISANASSANILKPQPRFTKRNRSLCRPVVASMMIVVLAASTIAAFMALQRHSRAQHRAVVMTDYIISISLTGDDVTLTVPKKSWLTVTPFGPSTTGSSAEQKALSWLVFDDPLKLWPPTLGTTTNQFRLQQRYALLTLLLQITDAKDVLSKGDECDWSPFVAKCIQLTWPPPTLNVVTEINVKSALLLPGSTLSPDLGLLNHVVSFRVANDPTLLRVANTGLTGSLPSSLGTAWTNLEAFDVNGNALTGTLPSLLGTAWTSLKEFDVHDNDLTGTLPSLLGTTWTKLKQFSVNGNALTGSLPSLLGATWTNLVTFDVHDNALTGSLSSSLGTNWTNLGHFQVSSNALSGTVPDNLARDKYKLQFAFFHNTSLVGTMPTAGFCDYNGLIELWADCIEDEVICPCCTFCCRDSVFCSYL